MRSYQIQKCNITLVKFCALLSLLSVCTFINTNAQDLQAEKTQAVTWIERGQPDKAIEALNKLSTATPTDASILYYVGLAQIEKEDMQSALASFDKGIQLNDKEALNYVGKGYVMLAKQNNAEAKALFDKAVLLTKSKNAFVLNAIANAYLNFKQVSDAEQALNKSKAIKENDPFTLMLIGDLRLQQGNGGQAVNNYENAIAADPKSALANYKIGLVYLRSKNLDAAYDAFNKAIALDPEFALAYKELAELYYLKKDGEKAAKAQEQYLQLAGNPESGKRQYAFYLFMAKDYAKANEIFKSVVQSSDVLPITYRFYGVSLLEVGDFEQSKAMFGKYFDLAKTDAQANDYAYYGKVLLKLKQDSVAVQNFQKSLDIDPNQVEIIQLKAESLYKQKRYAESIVDYQKLMSLRKKPLSQDYYGIGRAYYNNNQLAEADSTFSKLIELQPTMTVGYLWEARVKASEDPESTAGLAKPYFEKLVEIASPAPDKNKNDLIEAYSYLGYYHYLKKENQISKSYWEKVLKLNPNDARAKEALKVIP